MKTETFPLAMPEDLLSEVRRVAKRTGLSLSDTMRQGMKIGLPSLEEKLSTDRRVTNVDPWPDKVARALYKLPDDDTESIELFMKAQAASIEE